MTIGNMLGGKPVEIVPVGGLADLREFMAIIRNPAGVQAELDRLEAARAKGNADVVAAYDAAVKRLEKQIAAAEELTAEAQKRAADVLESARVTAGEMADKARTDQTEAAGLKKRLAEEIRVKEAMLLTAQADQINRGKELAKIAETLANRETILATREADLDRRLTAFQAAMRG